jgi:mono/diheme cytochrome c family protein
MHNQPKYKPLRETAYYPDQRSARPLVPGTVARGQLKADVAFYTGFTGNQQPVTTLPFPLTRKVLERGRERFNIYCAPCHSSTGDGDGVIVQRGYLRPPSLHEDRLRRAPIGHFFDVITNGLGGMPDYSEQVSPEDRWNIAAYIRALQLSQNATIADVPEDQRSKLNQPLAPPSQMIRGKSGIKATEAVKPLKDGAR